MEIIITSRIVILKKTSKIIRTEFLKQTAHVAFFSEVSINQRLKIVYAIKMNACHGFLGIASVFVTN